jgi:AraC-like DNA-binding protein
MIIGGNTAAQFLGIWAEGTNQKVYRAVDILNTDLNFQFHAATSQSHPLVTRFDEPCVEISLILEGSVRFMLDGQVREMTAPCATFQAYQQNLTVSAPANIFVRTIWCSAPANEIGAADWKDFRQLPPALPIPSLLPSLFRGALDIQGEEPSGSGGIARQVTNSLGRTILAEYIRNAGREVAQGPFPKVVKAVKGAIDADPFLPWTLEKLAEIGASNATYLIHLFKTYVGVTPIHYVWERRLDTAVQRLQTTDETMDQIASDCGFQSAAHFSRRVKEKYGRSPSQLRAR